MTVRKNIYLLLLTILLAWFGGIGNLWAGTSPTTDYTNNGKVGYGVGSNGFDIKFKKGDLWYSTTFSDGGYYTYISFDNGNSMQVVNGSSNLILNHPYTIGDLEITISVSIPDPENSTVRIQYTIKNNNNNNAISIKLGSCADTQVGSNDGATVSIEQNQSGQKYIVMKDGDAEYKISAGLGDYAFTRMWYGAYSGNSNGSSYTDHVFDSSDNAHSSTDTALAWSWDIIIPAGATVRRYAGGGEDVLSPQTGDVVMADYTYGDTPSTPSVSNVQENPAIVYYYNTTNTNSGGTQWTGITGTSLNAGTFYMYAKISATTNYAAYTTEPTAFTVNKRALTVKANNHSITYGEAPANNGVVYTGFAAGQDQNNLSGGLTYTYNYSQYDNVGTYAITPSGLWGWNYEITFQPGTLTVQQKEVGLTWTNTSFTYNGSEQKPTATATGLVNNDVVGVTVTGGQTNAGTGYTATASALTGTKSGNYKLPAANTVTFTILPKPITSNDITVTIAYATYTGQPQTPVITIKDETRTIVLDNNIDYTITYKGSTLQDVQTYASEIIITGTGNYTGTRQEDFTINPKDINLCSVEGNFANYTGNTINPGSAIMVKDGTTTLNTTDHYTMTVNGGYTYKEPNTYANAITITGKGNYTGTKNVNFSIVTGSAKNLADGKLLVTSNAVYTGTTQVPSASTITVLYDGQALETQYYDITYAPGTTEIGYKDARTYHGAITIAAKAGQADYYGNVTTDYVIQPRPVSQTTITVTDITYDSNPHATKNQLTVKYDDTVIDAANYTVSPASVTDVNIYTLTITGVNNLTGSTTAILKVKKAIDGTFSISSVPTQIYDGTNPVHPIVSVYDGGKLLTANVHYTITYGDNNTEGTNVGSIIVTGIDPYLASHTFHFDIVNEYFTEDDIAYHATSSTTVSVGTKTHVNAIATTSTGITIPASVTHVVSAPFQVTGVENGAFTGCSNLRYIDLSSITGYTPSTLERTIAASPFYGVPKQALVYLNGTSIMGENYVYKVSDDDYRCQTFKIYDDISGSQTAFSETNGYQWKFENRHVFTAYTVENTRQLTAGKHYTVCLPYNLLLPSTLKAYTMDGTNTANTLIGFAEVTGTLTAHNPYVIIPSTSGQPLGTTNVEVPAFTATDADAKTLGEVTAGIFKFYGTMRYMDGDDAAGLYIMQYNNGNPTWMQIAAGSGFNQSNKACVLPMRAYIKNTSGGAPQYLNATFTDATGETTTNEKLQLDEDMDGTTLYDLQGRRVAQPTKGLYIVNSRKVVIR